MPNKRKKSEGTTSVPELTVPADLLDRLVKGPMTPAEVEALCRSLKKAVLERAMGAELSQHLGYASGDPKPVEQDNHRNGTSGKTVLTDDGSVHIEVPRDRAGSRAAAHPQARASLHRLRRQDRGHVRPWHDGARIQGFLAEMYATEVSPEFISKVTDEVLAEVTAWQSRPLETMYPVIFFDALRVKIRDDAVVRNKAVYLALGVLPDGSRDVLGIWIEQSEGAKFWLKVFNDLKTRGVNDILIAVVDGLKGLAEAIEIAFPATTVQTCIVHLIRNSLDYATWKDRKAVAMALRPIYTAASATAAAAALEAFAGRPLGREVLDHRASPGVAPGST